MTPTTPDPATPPAQTPPSSATGPGAAVTPATPPPPPAAEGPRTAVIDAAPIGVDRAAGSFVTDTLRTAVQELGFNVIPQSALYAAARQLRLPFPVPAEGVFLLERALQAPVAVTAEVRALHRQYVVRLRVRVAVEPEERTREISASQWDLGDAIRAALPALLVPPDTSTRTTDSAGTGSTDQTPNGTVVHRRRVRAHPRHWEISLGPEFAFGPGRDAFFNALINARVAYFPQDRLGFSLTVSYANLRGRQSRVSDVLMMAGVETSVDLIPAAHVFIPLRAEFGYLPRNGPVFRVTAGVGFNLSRRLHAEIDVLSPTLWILPESSPVSLNLGAMISYLL